MADQNPQEIISNIERLIEEREVAEKGGPSPEETGAVREDVTYRPLRHRFSKHLEQYYLQEMREHQEIGKVPPGTRLESLKRLLSRVMRIISGPQSTYNKYNMQAISAVGDKLDELLRRVQSLEEKEGRTFGKAQLQATDKTYLTKLVSQHFHEIQKNMGGLAKNLQQATGGMSTMLDHLSEVSTRLSSLNLAQEDFHGELAASRQDLSRLWSAIENVWASLDDQTKAVWQEIADQKLQVDKTTKATQSLHSEFGELDGEARELKARLLVISEQLNIHLELLESLKTQVNEERGVYLPKTPPGEQEPPTPTTQPSISRAPESSPAKAPPAAEDAVFKRLLDLAYLRFQRQYRGDEEDLRERQQNYVEILEKELSGAATKDKCPDVLDVACGDGIFVQLLNEHGWNAEGVDINQAMVKQGNSRGLQLHLGDGLAFLESCNPASYDVVSAFQFIEHLTPEELMRLLRGCLRVLRPGGLILFETIYPGTVKSLHWFHLDLTHQRLVFPEMLQLLAETAGYSFINWKGINPVAEDKRLKEEGDEAEIENVRKLNEFLFGPQDYYFLARKSGGG